ncbi:hypothetical protein ACX1NX_15070 [Acinetobacter sp. ANC 5383]
MEFTVEELRDIYWAVLECNDVEIIKKIESVYQCCCFCNKLIKHEDYQSHIDECLNEE